ncbi:hypothetical protein EA472_19235 [Natrarchaeobius oligotrophus]|uniref:Uncharacterized protein n=1 Tax=Natrarchaeobius chitinivorans TaxID=1679083 RepID=A0A3N6MA12_NATCH|nr:hypothetical protein EA472_19235 [Natrarchaeobius chitinivorans]
MDPTRNATVGKRPDCSTGGKTDHATFGDHLLTCTDRPNCVGSSPGALELRESWYLPSPSR